MINNKLIYESVIVGLITAILGNLMLGLVFQINYFEENETLNIFLDKYNNTNIIYIALFFTGVLIHLLLEYIGLEKWYCSKVCVADKCKIVCEKKDL